eukprot:4914168-Heterocapsa_arctica.AAC.1
MLGSVFYTLRTNYVWVLGRARGTTTVCAQWALRKLVPHRYLPSAFPENANGGYTPQPLQFA